MKRRMVHKGVEYEIGPIEPDLWTWQFWIGGRIKTGKTKTRLELLEPTGAESPVAKFLAKRGPGVHHLCFAVEDLEKALADLRGRGFRLVNESPVAGAGGKRVAFLHPSAGKGVLIELSQAAPAP